MQIVLKHYIQFHYPSGYKRSLEVTERCLDGVSIPVKAFAYKFFDMMIVTVDEVECRSKQINQSALFTK